MTGRLHHAGTQTRPKVAACISGALAAASFAWWLSDTPAAKAQDARWVTRTLVQSGTDQNTACARARARAAETARTYQGLNIQQCQCRPIPQTEHPPGGGFSCRLTFEVLVRGPPITSQRDQQEKRHD